MPWAAQTLSIMAPAPSSPPKEVSSNFSTYCFQLFQEARPDLSGITCFWQVCHLGFFFPFHYYISDPYHLFTPLPMTPVTAKDFLPLVCPCHLLCHPCVLSVTDSITLQTQLPFLSTFCLWEELKTPNLPLCFCFWPCLPGFSTCPPTGMLPQDIWPLPPRFSCFPLFVPFSSSQITFSPLLFLVIHLFSWFQLKFHHL